MAIEIIKNGVRGRIESFVGKFLVAEYDPITGLFKAEKTLIVTNSTIDAGFSTEALALSAAEAAGWAELVVASVPAPTISPLNITLGGTINVTIAQNGAVLVYRGGVLIETLENKTTGTFTYTPGLVGGYSFKLSNGSGTSELSLTSVVSTVVSSTLTPLVYFPYELDKAYGNNGEASRIVQTGTFGEIISDANWNFNKEYKLWSLNGGPMQYGDLTNINLVSLKGKDVFIRIFFNIDRTTLLYRFKTGPQNIIPSFDYKIQIGN